MSMGEILQLNYAISRLYIYEKRQRAIHSKIERRKLARSCGMASDTLELHDEKLAMLHMNSKHTSMANIGPVNAHADSQRAELKKEKKKPRRRSSGKARELRALRNSMHEGEVVMQGPLSKMSSGLVKRWQVRFFALRGHYLKYFPDEQKACVKGVWDMDDLRGCTIPKPTSILLIFEGNTKLLLNAVDEQDARLWHANFSTYVHEAIRDAEMVGEGGAAEALTEVKDDAPDAPLASPPASPPASAAKKATKANAKKAPAPAPAPVSPAKRKVHKLP
jgi:hypothetical protein